MKAGLVKGLDPGKFDASKYFLNEYAKAAAAKLNAAINESLKSAEIGNTLTKLSVDARITSPEEFAAFLARERDKWTTVIKTAGVQAE